MAWRQLRALLRSKLVLILATAWPIAWYFLTVTLFLPDDLTGESLALSKGATAVSYAIFGAFTVAVAVFAAGFARDRDRGRYRLFRSLPIAPSADLIGRFLPGIILASGSYIAVLAVAYVDGARFVPRISAVPVIAVTLVAFCAIALALSLALALLMTEPEYVTTLAVVFVLVAYYATGFNGLQPGMIAEDAAFVNYLPNSLLARLHTYHLFDGDIGPDSGLVPPELPAEPWYIGLLVAMGVLALGIALGLLRLVGYRRD